MRRRDRVLELLRSQTTLTLATAASAGAPRAAPLFYVAGNELQLYWFSSPTSEHSRLLQAHRRAAVAVYEHTDSWREIRGVQMRGAVSVVSDGALRERIAKAYAEHFRLGRALQAVMAGSPLYEFRPAWVRYIDNSRRFGYRFELQLV